MRERRPDGDDICVNGHRYPAKQTVTNKETAMIDTAPQPERMLAYFKFDHLPPKLQAISEPWCKLAAHVVETIPASAERTVALRKLLEGKDAAVRAALP